MSEFREPATTYREIASEWRQWWREHIVFNWATHLILGVVNISFLYLYYDGFADTWYPVEAHWIALAVSVCWFVIDLRRDFRAE